MPELKRTAIISVNPEDGEPMVIVPIVRGYTGHRIRELANTGPGPYHVEGNSIRITRIDEVHKVTYRVEGVGTPIYRANPANSTNKFFEACKDYAVAAATFEVPINDNRQPALGDLKRVEINYEELPAPKPVTVPGGMFYVGYDTSGRPTLFAPNETKPIDSDTACLVGKGIFTLSDRSQFKVTSQLHGPSAIDRDVTVLRITIEAAGTTRLVSVESQSLPVAQQQLLEKVVVTLPDMEDIPRSDRAEYMHRYTDIEEIALTQESATNAAE